jgi:heme/copper-type cytochrome/quinol oxidase subunit 3
LNIQYLIHRSKRPLYIGAALPLFLFRVIIFIKTPFWALIRFFLIFLILNLYNWFKRLSRETSYLGSINYFILNSIKVGFILFLASEVIFFIRFFWGYFHFIFITPSDVGFIRWPPFPLDPVDYKSLALINTGFLLSRGYCLTNRHIFFNISVKNFIINFYLTLRLGLAFILTQILEYFILRILWSDRAYASIFYLTTGFHGVHVILGFLFLFVIFLKKSFINQSLFEFAAWYWHFVDIVWIFLFCYFYWLINF